MAAHALAVGILNHYLLAVMGDHTARLLDIQQAVRGQRHRCAFALGTRQPFLLDLVDAPLLAAGQFAFAHQSSFAGRNIAGRAVRYKVGAEAVFGVHCPAWQT